MVYGTFQIEEKLKTTEADRAHLQEMTAKYNLHYNKKKDIISKQAEQMDDMNKQLDYYKRVEDKLTKEVAPLTDKLSMEVAKNKKLCKYSYLYISPLNQFHYCQYSIPLSFYFDVHHTSFDVINIYNGQSIHNSVNQCFIAGLGLSPRYSQSQYWDVFSFLLTWMINISCKKL